MGLAWHIKAPRCGPSALRSLRQRGRVNSAQQAFRRLAVSADLEGGGRFYGQLTENPGSSLARATGHVVSILCIPYGYTVTLWCAGVLTITRYGMPSELEVLLFAAGAIGGFLACAWAGRGHFDELVPMRVPWIVVANVFPVVTTLAVIALPLGLVTKRWAYPLDSFLATVTYVLSPGAIS